jgi:ankyrin repeat protein
LAAASYGRLEMARWLLERGADKTTTNFQDKTALDIAEMREDEALIALLA